jgi:ATP-dependent RNA helicase RhlE
MALHGNKSQTARTQALGGFKSGDIRALVATDIAARGIDIDDLPHVVNYEIPNVPEDYVHRIGRTGRAGKEGQAVSLVCLDEEGFMQEIERFTRQDIPIEKIEGFGPDSGEQAQPIAMGRQVLWGGAGKMPSREVMNAAAKAARGEMMQRMRDNKATQPARGRPAEKASQPPAQKSRRRQPDNRTGGGNGSGTRAAPHNGNGNNGNNGNGQQRIRMEGDAQPRQGAHDSASPFVIRDSVQRHTDGQPDPLRTSVDSMAKSGRRGGGGGGGGGGGRSNNRSGGGYGSRNPAKTYGR